VTLYIGAMTRRLILKQPSGSQADGYSTVAEVWAAMRFLSPGSPEVLRFGSPTSIGQWLVQIWYRTDVKAEWILQDATTGHRFAISGYGDPDGRQTELQILATEVQ
jgi:head-tail adaptor